MSILVVQPSSKCDGGCLQCPWKFEQIEKGSPVDALNILKPLFDHFKFDDCALLCPNPLLYSKLSELIDAIKVISLKTTLFLPISVTRSLLSRRILGRVDNISLVISSYDQVKANVQLVKALFSQGIENLEAYILLDNNCDFAQVLSTIDVCKKCGLKITVGPMFYEQPSACKLIDYLERKKDVEVGLRYGRKYLYDAIRVFIDDYPVTVLTSRNVDRCRTLHIDPYGNISKCPLSEKAHFQDITIDSLRKMIFSPCPANSNTFRLIPRVRISFVAKNEIEISSEILELLELILWLKSFRGACRALGVPPSTFWERIKSVEKKLGVPLLVTARGGRKKGKVTLTDFAQNLVHEYMNAKKRHLNIEI